MQLNDRPPKREPRRYVTADHRPSFIILHAPTLLDAAPDFLLWAAFTGQLTEEPTMDNQQLLDLGDAIERRGARAIRAAALDVEPAASDRHAELCRKMLSDELLSEWLRMHSGRRLKRGETALLTRMHLQLDDAVQGAIRHAEPADMPATARAAIRALALPRRS